MSKNTRTQFVGGSLFVDDKLQASRTALTIDDKPHCGWLGVEHAGDSKLIEEAAYILMGEVDPALLMDAVEKALVMRSINDREDIEYLLNRDEPLVISASGD